MTASDARFRQLVKRAAFELRLAADIARTDGYEPQMRALVEGARCNLRRVLEPAGPTKAQSSKTGSKESEVDEL